MQDNYGLGRCCGLEPGEQDRYRSGRAVMRYTHGLMAELTFTGETVFLWLALALAVVFLAVLVLDRMTRRKRRRRHLHGHARHRRTIRKLLDNLRLLVEELRKRRQQRSQGRRRRRHGHRPPTGLR